MSESIVKQETPKTHKAILVKSTNSVVAPDEVFSYFGLPVFSDECQGDHLNAILAADGLCLADFKNLVTSRNFTVFVDSKSLVRKAKVLDAAGNFVCLAAVFIDSYILYDIIVDCNKSIFDTKEKKIALSKAISTLATHKLSYDAVIEKLNTAKFRELLGVDLYSEIEFHDPDHLYKLCQGMFFAGDCLIIDNDASDTENSDSAFSLPDYYLEVAKNLIQTGTQLPKVHLDLLSDL